MVEKPQRPPSREELLTGFRRVAARLRAILQQWGKNPPPNLKYRLGLLLRIVDRLLRREP